MLMLMKRFITITIVSLLFISCNEIKKEKINENKEEIKLDVAANNKSIEVEIEGMTCEIGCARTIESKLSKVNGISYSKVDFESGKGQFTYDTNKLSEDDIVAKINGIAGGDLYSVNNVKPLNEILKDSISS